MEALLTKDSVDFRDCISRYYTNDEATEDGHRDESLPMTDFHSAKESPQSKGINNAHTGGEGLFQVHHLHEDHALSLVCKAGEGNRQFPLMDKDEGKDKLFEPDSSKISSPRSRAKEIGSTSAVSNKIISSKNSDLISSLSDSLLKLHGKYITMDEPTRTSEGKRVVAWVKVEIDLLKPDVEGLMVESEHQAMIVKLKTENRPKVCLKFKRRAIRLRNVEDLGPKRTKGAQSLVWQKRNPPPNGK
ncbi:hypothetical protein H6P81_006078 [Aristolochia fimbriata]|uniref:Uncharacterized protein n=1 Tax=Aristolochia fimbriata TaxID=158543 RepID=A0AAV7EXP7_ARIFI|nr:hypothetical protein H6P81_006078 [Aristolochia fimbriata]